MYPQRVPTMYVLSKSIKIIKIFPMKFSIFTAEKNLCILYGQVFVMYTVYTLVYFVKEKLTLKLLQECGIIFIKSPISVK